MKKIRVLVVDDSSVIRSMMRRLLSGDPDIDVVGTAPDPFAARDLIVSLQPDVMTLDIEMPKMDGITFLSKAMKHWPIRTLIISSLTEKGSEMALRALEAGAIDVMQKPILNETTDIQQLSRELVQRVKMVAEAQLHSFGAMKCTVPNQHPSRFQMSSSPVLVAIASSTGGTQALKELLPNLPADIPGTVIVQHMPPVFTKIFAQRLQELCPFEVKEAQDGDLILPGRVLIAPGDYHMEIFKTGTRYSCKLHREPLLHGVRPAADYLFRSVAKYAGKTSVGIILTGMGKDGAEGLLEMKKAGAYTIAQDEVSCVVFGMPKEAIKLQAVDDILPLNSIADQIIRSCKI